MTGPVRWSRLAGTWYPADPAELNGLIDDCLVRAPVPDLRVDLRALVSPHAGIRYSGWVAAAGYRLLEGSSFESVILLGPNHRGGDGVALIPSGAIETPLGRVLIDEDLCRRLERAAPEIRFAPDAHADEHSVEIQLPFLQRFLPGVPVVPLLMGFQTPEVMRATARALEEVLAGGGGSILLVASSDLSHYEPRERARVLDSEVLGCLESFDPVGLSDLLQADHRHACGGGPMVSVLSAARALGASRSRVLAYGDSGDVTGDTSGVVGYVSAAFY